MSEYTPIPPAAVPARRLFRPGALGLGSALALTLAGTSHADIHRSVGAAGVLSVSHTPSTGSSVYEKERPQHAIAMPHDSSPERYSRYDQHIREAATLYQIPEELVRAVIKVESDFDPRAVSPANAHGLMQLIPPTAERMM